MKPAAVFILLLLSVSLTTISCTTSFNSLKEKYKSGKLINNNIYKFYFSFPYPDKITKSKEARQKYMKDHFPLECAHATLSHFRDNIVIGVASAEIIWNEKTTREIAQAGKNGKIIMIRWNNNKTCEVILEITINNLKEKISSWVEYKPMK